MNVEEFREFCLSLNGVHEKMPFLSAANQYSRDLLCFYVSNKWFCYVNIAQFDCCCLKSTPENAITLRERYEGIKPAWHMNKRMWNNVYFNCDVPDNTVKELVIDSYNLVVAGLPLKERELLQRNKN